MVPSALIFNRLHVVFAVHFEECEATRIRGSMAPAGMWRM